MKFVASSLVCLLVATYANAELTPEQKEAVMGYAKECKESTKATDADMASLKKKEIPQTTTGECFVACMDKKLKIMTPDNKIDVAHIKETTAHLREKDADKYDKALKVVETCAAEVNGEKDECKAAKKMMECSHKEAEAMGLLESSM